jgi:hypothetical protein
MTATTVTYRPVVRAASPERRLRQRAHLSRARLAALADVPVDHVCALEQGLPVILESRRRLHQVLWAMKKGK